MEWHSSENKRMESAFFNNAIKNRFVQIKCLLCVQIVIQTIIIIVFHINKTIMQWIMGIFHIWKNLIEIFVCFLNHQTPPSAQVFFFFNFLCLFRVSTKITFWWIWFFVKFECGESRKGFFIWLKMKIWQLFWMKKRQFFGKIRCDGDFRLFW